MSLPSASCPPSVDRSFGPHAGTCRGGFDFTVTFEEAILSIPVSILLIVASLWRVFLLKQRTKKTEGKLLLYCKLASLSLLVVVNLIFLAFVALPDERHGAISIVSAALQLVASMALVTLSYFEHVQTLRPSTIISAYLFALLLLDSARMRTMALISAGDRKSVTFAVSMALKVMSLVVESMTKSGFIGKEKWELSPEATSNMFIRSTFMWLRKLLLIGYTKIITIGDLFGLDPAMDSDHLASKFRRLALEKAGQKNRSTSLLLEALDILRWPILAAVPARLITMGLTFAQPFLLVNTVGLAAQPVNLDTDQRGYGLIGAFILVYIGLAISACQYSYKMVRVVTMMRGGLVSLVYARSMRLDPADQAKAGAALTHMNADVELIAGGAASLHEMWACPVEIGVGIWLVERQLGIACLIPVAVAIFAGGCTFFLSKRVNMAQTAWVAKITERITATGVTLTFASGLRLAGLLDKSLDLLQDIREDELRVSKPFRKLLIANMLLAYVSPILTPVLTFVVFSLVSMGDASSPFTVSRAFSSLALLNVISGPLTMIISMVPSLIVSYNSFNRIQQYCERADDAPAEPVASPSLGNEKSPAAEMQSSLSSSSDSTNAAVIIEKGYFSWTPGALAGVDDVNITILKGAFAMIVGPTGSGKSTILKGLVNEVPDVQGVSYCLPGPKGYCAQAPWLPAGTAREVIMAGSPVDDEWYKSVTSACQLQEDFGTWEDGDQHIIGSAGAALSGGQKQRVSLARCIYSRANLMLLDDTLTGLDVETKSAILEQVFGPEGLIRRLGATIILVSSTRDYSGYADTVIEIGDSAALSAPAAAADISAQATSSPVAEPPKPQLSLPKHIADAMDAEELPPKQEVTSSAHVMDTSDRRSSSDNEDSKSQQVDADNAREYGGRGAYRFYIKPVTWSSLITFTVSICIFTFCQAFPSVWLKMWTEHESRYPGTQLGKYLGVYAALGVGCIIAIAMACWNFFVDMIPQTGSFFHKVLAKTVSNAPLTVLVTTEAGEITSRFSQDLQLIDMELPLSTMNTFATLTICIASAVIVAVAGRYVAIAFPIVIAILFFIQKFYLRTSRQLRFLELETKAPLYSRFLECISGLSTIQAFHWEEHYERNQWAFLDTSQRAFYLFQCLQRWLTVTIDLLVALFAIVLAVVLVQMRSSIGGGYIAVGLVNIMSFNTQLKAVIMHWTAMEIALGAIARIRGFESVTTNENDNPHTEEAPPSWPSEGSVQIKNLNVTYGKSKTPTLKGVSLDIQPREKVAICGRTGSGKSTLLLALLRMLDYDQGSSVLIDGVDIQTLSRKQIRSQITYVTQEPAFIMDKVKTNLDPEGTATDEAMVEVLNKVGLWGMIQAAGGLEMTPMQLLPLSPGQKQLFVLARAMLRPKKIVLLDEPTSIVDDDTANRIKELMVTEFATSTVLNIAHRLETIRGYDKVLVLRDGRVAAYDSVSAVLEN